MRKTRFAAAGLGFILALGTGLASLSAAAAEHCGDPQRTVGQGQKPMMHKDQMQKMGQGHMPMMDKSPMSMMDKGQAPMMGRNQGPMMGRAQIPMKRRGGPIPSVRDLSSDDVREHLESQLAWYGNSRLKVGAVSEKDDTTVTAEIVTIDDSLVQRLEISRRTGSVRQVE